METVFFLNHCSVNLLWFYIIPVWCASGVVLIWWLNTPKHKSHMQIIQPNATPSIPSQCGLGSEKALPTRRRQLSFVGWLHVKRDPWGCCCDETETNKQVFNLSPAATFLIPLRKALEKHGNSILKKKREEQGVSFVSNSQ